MTPAPDNSVNSVVLFRPVLRQGGCQPWRGRENESLAIRARKEPDTWTTFNTKSLLGGARLGQKKYAEAEPLLRQGYEGMKAREKAIPSQSSTRLPEALDRLIELYTATDKPGEVTKWRAERAKYPDIAPPPPERK